MSDQIPLPAKAFPGLPEMPIDDRALAKFTIDLIAQLHDLEQRLVVPRRHPRMNFGQSRGASTRPR
jgi:hypothetical protein